jgi:hypothetical protein
MPNDDSGSSPSGPPGALPRTNFEAGRPLTPDDLLADQAYRIQRLRRHARRLHGWGVVCGLRVVPAGDPERPWRIWICPGYAIGPHGDEIAVPERVRLDVGEQAWGAPHEQDEAVRRAYVTIRYVEVRDRRVRVVPAGCGCREAEWMPTRVRDGFEARVLWSRPSSSPLALDLCRRPLASCPECPQSPYVLLACLTLPPSEDDPITAAHIDNRCREG